MTKTVHMLDTRPTKVKTMKKHGKEKTSSIDSSLTSCLQDESDCAVSKKGNRRSAKKEIMKNLVSIVKLFPLHLR